MKTLTKLFSYVTILGIAIVFTSSCASVKGTKSFQSISKKESYDAIIVPGFPHENGEWSSVTKMRVYWAAYLYKKGVAKNVIFSGGSVYTPYVEAKIMSLYAQKLGIPAENIITEEKAEHSSENLYYSYKLAKKSGFEKVQK